MDQITTRLTYTTTIHNNQKKKKKLLTLSTVRFFWESDIAKPHIIPKANSPTIPNHKFNKSKRKTLLMREAQKKNLF